MPYRFSSALLRLRATSRLRLAVGSIGAWTLAAGCDNPPAPAETRASTSAALAAPPATASTPAVLEPPMAPEIIIDRAHVDVGKNRVATGRGVQDRVAVFLRGAPGLAGQTPSVVAMRTASPSDVEAIVDALRQIGATGVNVKTEARDSTTQAVPIAFPSHLPDCTTIAWIARDASLEVWPAGGGTAQRVGRGLAGPDLTLGLEAVQKQESSCESPQIAVGADDTMSWGLVFDLAMSVLHAPWTRTAAAVLVTGATPGRKLPQGGE